MNENVQGRGYAGRRPQPSTDTGSHPGHRSSQITLQFPMQSVGNETEVVEYVFSPTKPGHIPMSYPVEPPGERAGVRKVSCQHIIDPACVSLDGAVRKDVSSGPSIELRATNGRDNCRKWSSYLR